jgi:anti-sigma B factor antagonist
VRRLAVKRSSAAGFELLVVEGQIDAATCARLIAALNEAVMDAVHSVVVDLSAVKAIDSAGLALLVGAHRRLRRRGCRFAVVCPPGPVSRIFEVTDLVETLGVRPSLDAAARAVGAVLPA